LMMVLIMLLLPGIRQPQSSESVEP
jgi:hypothetical protein